MLRKALLLTVLASLTCAGDAQALSGTQAGLAVGLMVWGTPACGLPHVEISTPAEYLKAHGTGNFDGDPEAWADEDRCVIVLNPHYTIHTAVRRCHVIVHEWGHLAGYRDQSNKTDPDHSDNPRSVMYAEDLVVEGRERTGKRWRWVAGGAFKPCYEMADPRTGLG